jgi:phospholipase C
MRVSFYMAAIVAAATFCSRVAVASSSTGSITDVQSIVIFMQENRAFDHYYGTLDGVCCGCFDTLA